MADPYISRREARASWRPYNALMSPGMRRAREPFRVRNAITGTLIAAFAVGVWAYSISAVKQDVFDDIDEEALAMRGERMKQLDGQAAERKLAEEATRGIALAGVPAEQGATPTIRAASVTAPARARGLLPPLVEDRFPRLLDPQNKTLVWGAPPVDNVGKML